MGVGSSVSPDWEQEKYQDYPLFNSQMTLQKKINIPFQVKKVGSFLLNFD